MKQSKSIFSFIILLTGFLLSLTHEAVGQVAPATELRDLEPSVAVERELAGGEAHAYRINLAANQHASIQIVKQGVNVSMTLKSPTGETLLDANFEALEQGTETFSLLAKTAGPHTLIVEPDFKKAPRGRYWLKLEELREATEQDRQRFAAQAAFVEATQLFKQQTKPERESAKQKLAESLAAWQSLGDRVWEARTLFWLGWTNLLTNDLALSLGFFNRTLELNRAARDRTAEAATLRALGMIHAATAKNQLAREHFLQALELQQGLAEHWDLAFTYLELGKLYWRLGEAKTSDHFFEQGLQGLRDAGDEENEVGTLTTLAFIQVTRGDYQSARVNLDRALPFLREMNNREGQASALNILGSVYYNLGDFPKAVEAFTQALSFIRELKRDESFVLVNLGITKSTLGKKREALDNFNRALQLIREIPNPRAEASLLRHFGQLYWELGDLPQALENLNQALRMAREQGEPAVQIHALRSLGQILAATGDPQKGLETLQLALPLSRAIRDQSGEAQTLSALSNLERGRGELGQAQTYAEAAIKIIESLRAKVTGTELRASYLSVNQGYYDRYIDLLMRRHELSPAAGFDALALQASERARARALLDLLAEARADIRQGCDPALLEREQSLQKLINAKDAQVRQLSARKAAPEQIAAAEREADQAVADFQQVLSQIRAASPRYAALTQPQPLELKEIQAQLDAETLLLVYRLGENRSFLWAVTPATVRSYALPARAKIESSATRFYELLKVSHQPQSLGQTQVTAQQLFRLLLGPAEEQLAGKRLVIVADGALQRIPFAALRQPGAKQYLIADHEIVSLPSVSALGQLRRNLAGRAIAPKTIAVFADPVFETGDERFSTIAHRTATAPGKYVDPRAAAKRLAQEAGLKDFSRLNSSRREAEQITALLAAARPSQSLKPWLDFDASRARLEDPSLSQYRILHFATHGVLNDKTSELSGIVLSLYDRAGQPQDGVLHAHEIFNLKLGADLVVLSACQTALGQEVRGEGLIGISRGFFYAGVPRLVVSLWNVNDLATAELMRLFYQGVLRDNLRPAAALRSAQAAMAQKPRWRAPYFWAGFVLQGEWK